MAYIYNHKPDGSYDRTSSSITVWLAGLDSDEKFQDGFTVTWYISGQITSSSQTSGNCTYYETGTQSFGEDLISTYSNPYKFVNLASNSKYYIQCIISVPDESNTILRGEFWTSDVEIKYSERTPTSISVYLTGLNPEYGGSIRYVKWFVNNTYVTPNGGSVDVGISDYISESQDFTLTGLTPSTSYSITCEVYTKNSNGTENAMSWNISAINPWTADEPYIQLAAYTQSSIGVTLKALDSSDNNHILANNPKLKWWLRQENADGFTETTPKLENGIYTFEGLENYTKYYVQCEILSSDERELYYVVKKLKNSTGADADGFRTMQSTPLLNFRSCTPNSITVYVTNLENAHYEYYYAELYISTDGDNWGNYVLREFIGQDETSTGVSNNYTIENLSPSTTYHIWCKIHTSRDTWTENTLTVTTQNSDGTGGGEEEGGGDTPLPPVDPTVPVIEIVQRQKEFIDVRLTNITAYENLVWIYWYVSDTSFMGSFDNFYIEASQWLKAGDTTSEEVRLNINFADRSICYINCVITNDGSSDPDFSNPSSILCSNIVEVVSEYNNFYAIGGPDSVNDNIFRISSDLKRLTTTCIVYNRSTGNYAEIYDTWHVNIYIDSYDNYITTFYQDEKDDFYGWVSPGLDNGIDLSGSVLEGYSGEHTLIAQAYFDTEWGEDGVFIGEKFETVNLPSSSSRPQNWKWTTNVGIGAEVRFSNGTLQPLTAEEWNGFTARVNEFRAYKGLSQYSFTTVQKGTEFTVAIYNEAVKAIKEIAGYGTYLSVAVAGVTNVLSSYLYTSLETELNAIQ